MTLRRACIVMMVCVAVNAFQVPVSRQADVYAIYSQLMTNPKTSYGADKNEIYFIAETAAPGTPEQPCVRFPAEHQRDYYEIMSEFNRGKDKPMKLDRAFHIAKPICYSTITR